MSSRKLGSGQLWLLCSVPAVLRTSHLNHGFVTTNLSFIGTQAMERQFHTPGPGSSPCSARSPSTQVNISVASQHIQGLETSTLILMSLVLQSVVLWEPAGVLITNTHHEDTVALLLLEFHLRCNRYPKQISQTLNTHTVSPSLTEELSYLKIFSEVLKI